MPGAGRARRRIPWIEAARVIGHGAVPDRGARGTVGRRWVVQVPDHAGTAPCRRRGVFPGDDPRPRIAVKASRGRCTPDALAYPAAHIRAAARSTSAPHRTAPHRTAPRLASPRLASPHLTSPRRTASHRCLRRGPRLATPACHDRRQSSLRFATPCSIAPSCWSSCPQRTSPSTRAPGASVSLPRVVITVPPPVSPTVPHT